MASVEFKVSGNVAEYMDSLKRKSKELSEQMIRDASSQTSSAKEQLRLVNERILATQRQQSLETRMAEMSIRKTAQDRVIANEVRFQSLYEANQERFASGQITQGEFSKRNKKISQLKENNPAEAILGDADSRVNELKSQTKEQAILAQLTKELLRTVDSSSKAQIEALKQGDNSVLGALEDNSRPLDRLANQLALDHVAEEQRSKKKEKEQGDGEKWQKSLLSFANALAIDRVGGMAAALPSTKNELDYVKPIAAMMGMFTGGMAGILADSVAGAKLFGTGLGQTSFGQLGMQIGEKAGEFAGSAIERTYRSRDALQTANFKLKAMGFNGEVEKFNRSGDERGDNALSGTGKISNLNQDLTRFGLTYQQVSELQYNIATHSGSLNNIERDSEGIAAMRNGWQVRDETSMSLLELVRSNREGDKNITSIVGGVLQNGKGIFRDGDRTFLNEFLTRNFSQTQKALLNTQTAVSSGLVLDVIQKFNGLGGAFSAQDSRSTGLINTVQSSLANPGSDSMKALSFYLMKKENPAMSMIDAQIEIQKGMGSPKYLQSLMKYIKGMGGDESYQVNSLANALGLQGNLAAARSIYKNEGNFGKGFSNYNLKGTGEYSASNVSALGEGQTSEFAVSTAKIDEAYLRSSVEGVQMSLSKVSQLLGNMLTNMIEMITGQDKYDEGLADKNRYITTYENNVLGRNPTISKKDAEPITKKRYPIGAVK